MRVEGYSRHDFYRATYGALANNQPFSIWRDQSGVIQVTPQTCVPPEASILLTVKCDHPTD